jgi:hypothetical protein
MAQQEGFPLFEKEGPGEIFKRNDAELVTNFSAKALEKLR